MPVLLKRSPQFNAIFGDVINDEFQATIKHINMPLALYNDAIFMQLTEVQMCELRILAASCIINTMQKYPKFTGLYYKSLC